MDEFEEDSQEDWDSIEGLSGEELSELVEMSRLAREPGDAIEMPLIARFCFICDKPITGVINGELKQAFLSPPNDAICFHASGNFGSTLFDPCGTHEQLEITICDKCVFERRHKAFMFKVKDRTPYTLAECETFEEYTKNWHE